MREFMANNSEERKKFGFIDKYKYSSTRTKIRYIVKIFVLIACLSGLSYYTVMLTEDYLKGETIVNIKVEKLHYTHLPAITICYPFFISMENLVQLYPEFETDYNLYKNFVKNTNENSTVNDIMRNVSNKYSYYSEKALSQIPVYQSFDNLSFPFNQLNTENSFRYSTEASVKGVLSKARKTSETIIIEDINPIESIAAKYGHFPPRKCFTFFSTFRKNWREFNLKIEKFRFIINFNKNWFPKLLNDKNFLYYFAMHSPDILPLMEWENNYLELKPGNEYSISFSRIRTKLLPPKYKTNCHKYNVSDINGDQSQIDCIDRCVLRTLRDICDKCIPNIGALFRKEYLKFYEFDKLCNYSLGNTASDCYYERIGTIHPSCRSKCRSDCDNEYLDFIIHSKHKMENHANDGMVRIEITHNRLPDQNIIHKPEITFISFLANFGGLAGMWLGMSAFALYNLIETFFKVVI